MPINRVRQGLKQCGKIYDRREKRERLVLGFAKVLYILLLIEEVVISLVGKSQLDVGKSSAKPV